MGSFIDLNTGEYPLTLEDIHIRLKRVSFPSNPTIPQLLKYGYCRVNATPKPEGHIVVEGKPRYLDGGFYQTWRVEQQYDIERFRRELTNEVDRHYSEFIQQGYTLKDHHSLSIADNDDLSFVFLECLMLKDEDSKETVSLVLTDGERVDLTYVDALPLLRAVIQHKRSLLRWRQTLLAKIAAVDTEEAYHAMHQLIASNEGVSC